MRNFKKISAFLLGLAVCTSVSTVGSAFADEEESAGASVSEEADEAENEIPDIIELPEEAEEIDESEFLTFGDFEYSVTDADKICIQKYKGSDSEVVIPSEIDGKDVDEIENQAFFETSVEKVTIPATVTFIADNPFVEAKNLKEIAVEDGNKYYFAEDGVLYLNRAEKKVLLSYPQGKADTEFTVPEDVETIGAAAIYDTKIQKIILPDGLSSIQHHGISFNNEIKSVDMSSCEKLTSLDSMCFTGCESLEEVIFSPNLLHIKSGAFALCKSLKDITLPDRLEAVEQNAFAGTAMTKVVIPSSVSEVGYSAFGYDENLDPIEDFVVIGDKGSAAEKYATDKDDTYDYENNFTFYDTSQADLIGESAELNIISGDEFMYAVKDGEVYIMSCLTGAASIDIPEEIDGMPVTCIYGAAFYQNELKAVKIPDSVTKIGSLAFADCTSLEIVKMPASLKQIDTNAFSGCTNLQYIDIPAECEIIGDEAFYSCLSLTEFRVDKNNQHFSSENGILYNADKTHLIAYPCEKTDKLFKAPDTLTDISISAFAGNSHLEKAEIPSVVNIADYAFEDCDNLNAVVFSDNLRKVGDCAFYDCPSLLSVRLFPNIEEIGNYAFGYHYDEHASDGNTDAHNKEFTIFCEIESGAVMYSLQNNITCENDLSLYQEGKSPAEVFKIFGYNVAKPFVYVVSGILGAGILGLIGFLTAKKIKKNKS